MKVTAIVTSVFLLALGACTREQPSRIVKFAEQSGAGPLADVSILDMRVWLRDHPQVATRVDALCAPLRANAPAAWPQTTEGRLCLAARAFEAQRQPRRNPDTTGFLPGWK
ncbi:MAG TPA: hypothetical protein VMR62_26620 [Bryobacteraceae bacterium]|jgi:hypothetical protein|nr:hypothetical protein [Bryobacteraceae bacterium]